MCMCLQQLSLLGSSSAGHSHTPAPTRDNLERLAIERGYRRGWCWYMLRTRWGETTLRSLGLGQPGQAVAAP